MNAILRFMQLSEKQKRHLRRLAHDLKPLVHVGAGGISAGLTNELSQTLEHHELVKVRLRVGAREQRTSAIEQLLAATQSSLVARIGNIAVLYRRRHENPGILLP